MALPAKSMPGAIRRSCLIALAAVTVLPCRVVAQQSASVVQIEVPAGTLAEALLWFANTTGIELLFDTQALALKRTLGLHLRLAPEDALNRLLADSGYKARQIGPHRYVLVAEPAAPAALPAEAATPEILVIGRRSLNLDIPRTKDDIQPYRVISGEDVRRSQGQSLDDVLRTRLPSNVQALSARQAPTSQNGSVRSETDLRGFGPLHTLILIDGRRLPSLAATNDFRQPDINALPLSAIARVETLGGTAGSIYGPGATGGVVNIVLRHDYPGLWLHAATGVSARGDGMRHSVEGGFAWSNDRTRIDLLAGYGEDDGLRFGDRAFVQEARSLRVIALAIRISADRGPDQHPGRIATSGFVGGIRRHLA